MTLEQIRTHGLRALVEELGTAGAVRFLQLTETGRGDYSRERQTRQRQKTGHPVGTGKKRIAVGFPRVRNIAWRRRKFSGGVEPSFVGDDVRRL